MFDLMRALAQYVLLRAKARGFVDYLPPDINVGVSQQQQRECQLMHETKTKILHRGFSPVKRKEKKNRLKPLTS